MYLCALLNDLCSYCRVLLLPNHRDLYRQHLHTGILFNRKRQRLTIQYYTNNQYLSTLFIIVLCIVSFLYNFNNIASTCVGAGLFEFGTEWAPKDLNSQLSAADYHVRKIRVNWLLVWVKIDHLERGLRFQMEVRRNSGAWPSEF